MTPGATPWRRDPYFKHAEVRIRWWFDGCWMFTLDRRSAR